MPLEGYYVVDRRKDIYAVKGLIHPPSKVVAAPKYLWTDSNYVKIPNTNIFEKIRREYLHEDDENYGTTIPAIPLSEVISVKKPTWNIKKDNTKLVGVALNLYREISQYSELEEVGGFTGSLLLGFHNEESDIDIAIYGLNKGKELYEIMQELRRLEITHPLSKIHAEHFLKSREDTSETAKDWIEHETRKVLTGVYLNKVYNIKLVPYPSEIKESYGVKKIERLEKVEVICRIYDDKLSIFTPNIYKVKVLNVFQGSDLAWYTLYLTSFRSRYCEQGKSGEIVRVRGTLEKINEKDSGSSYYRIIVGVDNVDYMLKQK